VHGREGITIAQNCAIAAGYLRLDGADGSATVQPAEEGRHE